jgi:predicted MFS family arabinose efflux permease
VLGGWLIDLGSWRAILLLNLPLATAAILLAWRYVPHDAEGGDQSLDWVGALLSTVGLGLLPWALTVGSGQGGWSAGAVIAVSVAFGLLVLFVFAEDRRGERAMMPLALFASKSFVGLTLLTLLLYGALSVLFVLIPYVLIKEAHYSATAAGAALLPLPLVLSVASPVIGGLAERIGPRLPLTIGPLGSGRITPLTLRISALADYWTEVLPAILTSGRASGAVAPLTTTVLNSVDATPGSALGFNSAVAHRWPRRDSQLLRLGPRGARKSARERYISLKVASAVTCMGAAASALILITTGAFVAERESERR